MRPSALLAFLLALSVMLATFQGVYCAETLPWGVERIRAYLAWDNNRDMTIDNVTDPRAGQGVVVAVIDTGIDYSIDDQWNKHYHPDLADNVLGGKGFKWTGALVEENDDYQDTLGHGTHVAGTITAVDNDIGVIGVAPKVKIYALKLVNQDIIEVAAAINWSVQHGANIISMSLGYGDNDTDLYIACKLAHDAGRILVAASGNLNTQNIDYPAKYDFVLAVGAVYQNLSRWADGPGNGSNYGLELDYVAPGVDIYSTWFQQYGGYCNMNGTSMAVPHVSGELAMIWGSKLDRDFDFNLNGQWDAVEVEYKLYNRTLHLPDYYGSGRNDEYGWGFINAWGTSQRPVGDINMDYKVNAKDVAAAARAFGSYPGHPLWDARCDVNIDNKVDARDVGLIADQFGKKDP